MAEFDDGKESGALRTIGEVSDALDIKPHVLRYWEQQFSLLKPLKRSGGRRYYRPADVELVEAIDRLVNQEGYTLKGAEAVLRSSGKPDLDRRQDDRRSGDRRAGADGESGGGAATDLKPKVTAAVAKLKTIRARLAGAIEA
ncbi:MerR family transcriptional regulator [Erythrobacter insulae]|uniref:MerR family transcriptional regulator n=1 Tax=Erythrobacter insulae TaxID=2584124 RepID=A0A547PDN6_9SPHN|nr:MerR family transcriptional regulator [Erythrobacter insulae]TRD12246.1 MerR family transcriptional regulator [Erythrobacter insulae]